MRQFRTAFIIMSALGFLFGQSWPSGAAGVAKSSSTWYWQNPLPHPYSVNAVACASAARCVAVAGDGTTLRTSDAGRHWTVGTVGAVLWMDAVSCPSPAVCYALGEASTSGASCCAAHLLKSSDGGVAWQEIPLSVPADASAITCPNATTCLVSVDKSDGEHLFRTTDSGRAWDDVFQGGGTVGTHAVPVSCPSSRVCYAGSDVLPQTAAGPYDWTHVVYRSEDAGKTWTQWWQSGQDSGAGIGQLACSPSGRCLVGLLPHVFAYAALLLVQKDGKGWTRIDHGAPHRLSSVTCLDGTACLVFGGKVMQSADGGKTWATRPLTLGLRGRVVCPASRTCYAAAFFTVVKTGDGFGHTSETPASSSIGTPPLGAMRCPTRDTCYAYGMAYSVTYLAVTTNGGRTWTTRPNLPLGYASLACPSSTVCYAAGTTPHAAQWLIYLTRDGARHWQPLTLPAQTVSLTGPSCPAVETCYVGAQMGAVTTSSGTNTICCGFALLVTRDGGATWSVRRAVDRVPGHSSGHPGCGGCGIDWGSLGSPSCPSSTTCFETVPTWTETGSGWVIGTVVVATRDGGNSWTVAGQCQPSIGQFASPSCGSLTCPTATSCYLLSSVPAGSASLPQTHALATSGTPSPSPTVPAPPPPSAHPQLQILATHDSGASWHSAVLGAPPDATGITCGAARVCHVLVQATGLTSAGDFATTDGGTTWQKQTIPADVSGLACPGAHTCYAVGGMDILATRPR